ncbi:glycosyltransferase [Leptolyngbya sp. AN02str]|uniref:glycosyltransferase n=1 Tax=Leptolyngbya sp. AN02str TaxID=3423363 RepID=UPI003D321DDE
MLSIHSDPVVKPAATVVAPFVSVIVPVYNDADRLKICLTSLAQQTYQADRYEVIVVDNGSDPEHKIAAIASEFEGVICAQELTPSSYAARNKGLTLAKGDVIAFTDSDCIPSADWLEKGVGHLLGHPECGLVAGKIDIFFQDPECLNAIELYDGIVMGFPQQEFLEKRRGAATANVLTWKQVIEQVGGFKSQMKSHGDLEWGSRVFAAGYAQIYADDVCVAHPARYSMEQIRKRMIRLVGGVYDMYIEQEQSWWKRNKRFLRLIYDDLMTHLIHDVATVLRSDRLNCFQTRLKVIGIVLLMKYVSVREKIRLKLGGKARRG